MVYLYHPGDTIFLCTMPTIGVLYVFILASYGWFSLSTLHICLPTWGWVAMYVVKVELQGGAPVKCWLAYVYPIFVRYILAKPT